MHSHNDARTTARADTDDVEATRESVNQDTTREIPVARGDQGPELSAHHISERSRSQDSNQMTSTKEN